MSGFDTIFAIESDESASYGSYREAEFEVDCTEDWSSVADGDGVSLFVGNMVKCAELPGWVEVVSIGRICTVEDASGDLHEVPASELFQL